MWDKDKKLICDGCRAPVVWNDNVLTLTCARPIDKPVQRWHFCDHRCIKFWLDNVEFYGISPPSSQAAPAKACAIATN